MHRGFKVVAFIPSGRERTMSLLTKYLAREQRRGILDGLQIWVNTKDKDDLKYFDYLAGVYPWVELKPPIGAWLDPKQLNTGKFYVHTQDTDTIYIRFDDDIIYLHEDALTNLLDFRLNNRDYFLIFATIWNNAIISYLQQQAGHIDESVGVVKEAFCMDPVGWASPEFGEHVHRILLKHIHEDTVKDLYIDHYPLKNAHRFSISCFAFFGAHMKGLVSDNPNVPPMPYGDEEVWLTEVIPRHYGWRSIVTGNTLVSHFTFFTQREHILKTDILDQYIEVSYSKAQSDYYEGLEKAMEGPGA
jgi:hypothetical protein